MYLYTLTKSRDFLFDGSYRYENRQIEEERESSGPNCWKFERIPPLHSTIHFKKVSFLRNFPENTKFFGEMPNFLQLHDSHQSKKLWKSKNLKKTWIHKKLEKMFLKSHKLPNNRALKWEKMRRPSRMWKDGEQVDELRLVQKWPATVTVASSSYSAIAIALHCVCLT